MFNLYLKNPENILFIQEKFKISLDLLKACMIE